MGIHVDVANRRCLGRWVVDDNLGVAIVRTATGSNAGHLHLAELLGIFSLPLFLFLKSTTLGFLLLRWQRILTFALLDHNPHSSRFNRRLINRIAVIILLRRFQRNISGLRLGIFM